MRHFDDTYPLTCITSVFFRVNPWFQLPLRDIPVPNPQTLLESKDDACKKAGYLCGRNVLKIWLTDLGDSILFPTRRHCDQCNPDCGSTHWFLGILDENGGSSPLPKGSLVKVLIWKHDTLLYLFSSWGSHIMASYDHFQPHDSWKNGWWFLSISCNASIPLYWSGLMNTLLLQSPVRCEGSEKQKWLYVGMFQKDKISNGYIMIYYQNQSHHHVEHFQTSFTPQKSIQTPSLSPNPNEKNDGILPSRSMCLSSFPFLS